MQILILITIVTAIIILINFSAYLGKGRISTKKSIWKAIQLWTVVFCPSFFLIVSDLNNKNDCCAQSAIFSPEHRIGIYTLIILCIVAFVISMYRKMILPPLSELFLNVFLILGFILNLIFFKHFVTEEEGYMFSIFGNLPIIVLLLIELSENEKKLQKMHNYNEMSGYGYFRKISVCILKLDILRKYPLLTLLLAPILILLSAFLLLFGQKPDSLIRAFTDTYQHGFSQLDYLCDNVMCGGHFLCSVGANGHNSVVKPIRYGEREGHKIICNRQLLISNAFEDLIQSKFPIIHTLIRHQYNKLGNKIHRYYAIFSNKYVSDLVYILMKPIELFFLLVLYIFDNAPENRIAKQYLNKNDREKIDTMFKENN